MNIETIRKWIIKAENDLKIGKDEIITANPATDAICFHMQQCIEKYLKVYLIYNGQEIRKTHNIAELVELCSKIDIDFRQLYEIGIAELTSYAIGIRYGDDFYIPSVGEAKEAIELAERAKEFVLKKLVEKGYKE